MVTRKLTTITSIDAPGNTFGVDSESSHSGTVVWLRSGNLVAGWTWHFNAFSNTRRQPVKSQNTRTSKGFDFLPSQHIVLDSIASVSELGSSSPAVQRAEMPHNPC